jgi:endogenous inhibitor of DNA gyrase (YacG/DUF329 family)
MSDVPLCVYCRQRPVEMPWGPFCSKRCKMADLGRWLSGDYRVPVRQETTSEPLETPDGATEDPETS